LKTLTTPTTRNSLRKASNAARNNRNNRVQDPAVQDPAPDRREQPSCSPNPVIPILSPGPGPTPIPTTKRVRDEELERLVVEGRLRVLKLRKEIEAIQGPLPDG
jgi:hypothetical protein